MMTVKNSAYHVTLLVVFSFSTVCIDNCIVYSCTNTKMHVHPVTLTSYSTGAVRIIQSLLVDSQSWGYTYVYIAYNRRSSQLNYIDASLK